MQGKGKQFNKPLFLEKRAPLGGIRIHVNTLCMSEFAPLKFKAWTFPSMSFYTCTLYSVYASITLALYIHNWEQPCILNTAWCMHAGGIEIALLWGYITSQKVALPDKILYIATGV